MKALELTPSDGKETVRCFHCDAVILDGSGDCVVFDTCEACERLNAEPFPEEDER